MPEPVAVCGKPSDVLGAEVPAKNGETAAPGDSPLDDALQVLAENFEGDESHAPGGDGGEGGSEEGDDDEDGAAELVLA